MKVRWKSVWSDGNVSQSAGLFNVFAVQQKLLLNKIELAINFKVPLLQCHLYI